MRWFWALADRLLLIACVLAAAAAPSFATQYAQRVDGRLAQARADLAPFQQIAERRHNGSIEALIAHSRRSDDPSVREAGDAVADIVAAIDRYARAVAAMQGDLLTQGRHLALDARKVDLRATWDQFTPGFGYAPSHLLFAVAGGLLVWLLLGGTCRGCAHAVRRLPGRRQHPA